MTLKLCWWCQRKPSQAAQAGDRRPLFAHIPETSDCWNTMCSSAVMCLAEMAKQNKMNKWQQRRKQSENAPDRPHRNKIRSNGKKRFWPPGPTYWQQAEHNVFGCPWIYSKFLMLVRNKQSMEGDRLSHLFVFCLPSFCLSAGLGLKDVPDLLPKHQPPPHPADMAGDTRTHTHTDGRMHTEKHASLACVFKHVRLFTCASCEPWTNAFWAQLSYRWKNRPTLARIVSDSDTIRLKFTRSPSTPTRMHAGVRNCHLLVRHVLFLQFLSTPTHILPCLDTPTAAHVRAARSWRTPCVVARQAELVRWSILTSDTSFVRVSL